MGDGLSMAAVAEGLSTLFDRARLHLRGPQKGRFTSNHLQNDNDRKPPAKFIRSISNRSPIDQKESNEPRRHRSILSMGYMIKRSSSDKIMLGTITVTLRQRPIIGYWDA